MSLSIYSFKNMYEYCSNKRIRTFSKLHISHFTSHISRRVMGERHFQSHNIASQSAGKKVRKKPMTSTIDDDESSPAIENVLSLSSLMLPLRSCTSFNTFSYLVSALSGVVVIIFKKKLLEIFFEQNPSC